jgi:hypothetical protein
MIGCTDEVLLNRIIGKYEERDEKKRKTYSNSCLFKRHSEYFVEKFDIQSQNY